ncbi:GNAT family N-acetyltransferase [Caproiciproducens sp. MSJ-32]|uniref:GNAT family N-acetyltransferase n=1 Tax=Caproiciproducens sp. MSJ-32 TaxID=2841527 RepID=UPI002ED0AB17
MTGFGITPEFRARGYGRQALSTILNLLNKEDIFWAELDVEVKNKGALKLYTSCGFKEESIMNYYEYRG